MNCAFFLVGLGPSNSNERDISGFNSTPTFVETLVAQNQISVPIFGIYIAPLGANGTTPHGSGEITFGGINKSKVQVDELFFLVESLFSNILSKTWTCRQNHLGRTK